MPLLPTIKEEETQTCFQQLWHCRYQLELMIPASLVFFAGGLKLAWTIFEAPPPYFDYEYNSNLLTAALFIGGLLGCITASAFVGRITKNIAHVASGSLLILGGILFIAVPNMFFALIFSCIFEGAALTISQVQAFSVGPEMANKDLRGFVMSMERCCLWFGILTQLTFTHVWYAYESPISGQRSIHSEQVHGLVVACLGFVSIVVALKQRTESPLLLLRQQRELAASAALKRLVDTQLTTTEVMRLREDCLQLLSIDADQSGWFVFRKLNARPLLKVFILRLFVALTMSQPFNRIYLSASWLGFDCDTNCLYTIAAAGVCGSVLGSLLIDKYGRRRMSVATLLPATIFMLITGGILEFFGKPNVAVVQSDLEIVACLMLLFQFIICVGISIAASVYMSEAFTITQKSKCIAVILAGENLLQMVLALVSSSVVISDMVFSFAIGFLCMLLGLCVFFCMPETKCLTIYEALQKFKRV